MLKFCRVGITVMVLGLAVAGIAAPALAAGAPEASKQADALKRIKSIQQSAARCESAADKKRDDQQKRLARIRCMLVKNNDMISVAIDLGLHDLAFSVAEQQLKGFGVLEQARQMTPEDRGMYLSLLELLARTRFEKGEFASAAQYYKKLIEEKQKQGSIEPKLQARALRAQGMSAYSSGRFAEAGAAFDTLHAMELKNPVLAEDAPLTLTSAAGAWYHAGDLEKARDGFERARTAFEKTGLKSKRPMRYALVLSELARLQASRGQHAQSRALAEEAWGLVQAASADALKRIDKVKAALAGEQPEQRAEQAQADLRHLAIAGLGGSAGAIASSKPRQDQHDPYEPELVDVTACMLDLAAYYSAVGDYARAEQVLHRAIEIDKANLGTEHATVALDQNNLGDVYYAIGKFDKARERFEGAVTILEKAKGDGHPDVAGALQNAGLAGLSLGDVQQAEPLLTRAVTILQKSLGQKHPSVALAIHNLARARQARGELGDAIKLETQSYEILRELYGDKHPAAARALQSLATMSAAAGDLKAAMERLAAGNDALEKSTSVLLGLGSESQKLAYFNSVWRDTDSVISLQLQAARSSDSAARLAMTTILRRKARVLDAVSDSVRALRFRAPAQDRALLDQLASVRSRLATAMLRGPGERSLEEFKAELAQLESEAQRIEQAASQSTASLLAVEKPVTLDDVQAALPAHAALVEYVVYRPLQPKAQSESERWGAPVFAAYVLRRFGAPVGVSLGPVSEVVPLITRFRTALSTPSSSRAEVLAAARALGARIIDPLRQALRDADELYVSPEGQLNLVPFEALVDAHGKYLVESALITYLTTGRDLLKKADAAQGALAAAVYANPDFEGTSAGAAPSGDRAADVTALAQARFSPLPGTSREAQAIKAALAKVELNTGAEASKAALIAAGAPPILHIATHGFFLGESSATSRGARALELQTDSAQPAARAPLIDNPLLRSGLAFAGANRHGQERAAGILTALEASGLDLHGTRLVVLSACETGVGDVRNGDGVYGLRRALEIAGAQTQVISLWKVDDTATAQLMKGYYERLVQGDGRSNAMRMVRLELLGNQATAHPYYWASFIVSGSQGNLQGHHVGISQSPSPAPGKVEPSPRGCACDLSASAPAPAPVLSALAMALAALRLRRRNTRLPAPRS